MMTPKTVNHTPRSVATRETNLGTCDEADMGFMGQEFANLYRLDGAHSKVEDLSTGLWPLVWKWNVVETS